MTWNKDKVFLWLNMHGRGTAFLYLFYFTYTQIFEQKAVENPRESEEPELRGAQSLHMGGGMFRTEVINIPLHVHRRTPGSVSPTREKRGFSFGPKYTHAYVSQSSLFSFKVSRNMCLVEGDICISFSRIPQAANPLDSTIWDPVTLGRDLQG